MHASNDQKTKFALAVLHKTLQHFDMGGISAPMGMQNFSNLSAPSAMAAAPTPPPGDPNLLNGPSPSGSGTPSRTTGVLGGLNDFLGTQNNFQAGGANIQAGTNVNQLNNAYTGAADAIGLQKNFANAAAGQNGFGNLQSAYDQNQNIANGVGPNPAQAMLNAETGRNVANQAALMASVRGASTNPALIARLAAEQGANTQQNSVGQGASLEANQRLNAVNNLGNIAQNQVNSTGQALNNYGAGVQNEQNILQNANSATNNAAVGMQSNLNNVNAQVSQGNQQSGNHLLGGTLNGVASAVGLGSLFAKGGEVQPNQGTANYMPPQVLGGPNIGYQAPSIDTFQQGQKFATKTPAPYEAQTAVQGEGSMGARPVAMARGGRVGPKSRTGMLLAGRPQGQNMAQLQPMAPPQMAAVGGRVPGKPVVGGRVNTQKNDRIPALLSAEEIVLPRSVTKSKDPAGNAAKFVAALLAKKQGLRTKAA